MKQLETERLTLRNFQGSDGEALPEMIGQYQNSGMAAFDQPWPTSAEEIKKIAGWFAGGDNFMAVCLKDTGQFIGFVALNPEQASERKVFNIGYIFNFRYHGNGYATEACRAVLAYAFQTLQADELITGTGAANLASCKLLARLGLRKTGESMASFQNSPDGKPIEFLGYSFALSRSEWKAAKTTSI